MTRSLVQLTEPRLLVGDTGALMNEVIQGTRNQRLTSLVVALHFGSVRLFLPRHVVNEIERDLPGYAADRRVDVDEAMARWRRYYLPYARMVDVPETWGTKNPLVQHVVARHKQDAPAARLAGALAPCFVLTEDADLTTHGFGNRDWLPMVHAFANHAEMEVVTSVVYLPSAITSILGIEAARAVMRWPRWAQLVLLAVIGIALYRWQRDGLARRHAAAVKATAADLWRVVGPPLTELLARYNQAAVTRYEHEIRPNGATVLQEAIARVLALGTDSGMLAREIVDRIRIEGTKKDRLAEVRQALSECQAFTEVSRGRWHLGRPMTETKPDLPPEEFAEWLRRAHATTLPPTVLSMTASPRIKCA